MKNKTGVALCALFVMLSLALGTSALTPVLAAEEKGKDDTRPERGVSVAFEYPGVVINTGDDVTVDLIVKNKGRHDESIAFKIASSPKGWNTRIKTYRFTISGVFVPEDKEKTVQFNAKPDKDTTPGTYTFRIVARSADGVLTASPTLKITLTEKSK
jgi:uncharacterized membrane protein